MAALLSLAKGDPTGERPDGSLDLGRRSLQAPPIPLPPPEDISDPELVRRARTGDRESFGALIARHQAMVLVLARRYVGNDVDAQDIAQSAFLQALDKVRGFRGAAQFRTWLIQIALHLAMNHRRALTRSRMRPLEDRDFEQVAPQHQGMPPGPAVWERLEASIAELPPRQRQVVELRVFAQCSHREIAQVLDCAEDAARASFYQGIKRLKDAFKDVSDDDR